MGALKGDDAMARNKAWTVRKNAYFDSVFLMQVQRRLEEEPGVERAAAVMATGNNRKLLAAMGFSGPDLETAGPNDLVVAVEGGGEAARAALGRLDEFLARKLTERRGQPHTLEEGLTELRGANLAVISVPGRYAAREARGALARGLNVFLFSSNVPLEEEIALKETAQERGLIVMGPDCGTALVRGVGIGFANVIRRGAIGAIGSSGTGLQEVTCLVHRAGAGISHALGTGSRDLKDPVGGLSTLAALAALEDDPETLVIVLVSKPPGVKTLAKLRERLKRCPKPVVACFLGATERDRDWAPVHLASTLDAAAANAVSLLGGDERFAVEVERTAWEGKLAEERAKLASGQKYLRGLFAGGTFCYEAQCVLQRGGVTVHSNAPLDPKSALPDPMRSIGHTMVDLGDEAFTEGRAHPMIDATLRRERLLQESRDGEVAVVFLDFILGHNASPDPVGDLLPAIVEAKRAVARRGGYSSVVATVCGTEDDPQGRESQVGALQEAGVVVLGSNAQAALYCLELVKGLA